MGRLAAARMGDKWKKRMLESGEKRMAMEELQLSQALTAHTDNNLGKRQRAKCLKIDHAVRLNVFY